MDYTEIVKEGVIGGVVAIVLEFIVGAVAMSVAYDFGFIALLVGGAVAGWMIKGKQNDAIVSGVVAGLVYVIIGLFIIFPLVSSYQSASPIGSIIVGIVLGAIGGFAGYYLAHQQGSSRSARKKM